MSQTDADARYPVLPERLRVRSIVQSRLAATLPADRAPACDVVFSCNRFEAQADLWLPWKPAGMAAGLVRDATTIKERYLDAAAFLHHCIIRSGAEAARYLIYHLNQDYVRGPDLDGEALIVQSDVTRRVRLAYRAHECRLDELEALLADDPCLDTYRDRLCDRPAACQVCSQDLPPLERHHVSTLHRGGPLVDRLLADGFTTIDEVPPERLVHRKQEIQRSVIVSGRPHVDGQVLGGFLGSLTYPRRFLDFEAWSTAVPSFPGTQPWEHVPYLYSVHVEEEPGGPLEHRSFLMRPGLDEREELARRLVADLGDHGSIIVYSATFELGILTRLAAAVPEHADALNAAAQRVVDLLEPFNAFAYYHEAQRGKVRLKSVLPALTSEDYSDQEIRDGYTANLAYRYLSESDRGNDEAGRVSAALESYCEMDTLAMVRIVAELERAAAAEAAE